jgi:hypothetical protein
MRFESRRGQNEKKKRKQNAIYNSQKHIFFTARVWLVLWLCISKMICKA